MDTIIVRFKDETDSYSEIAERFLIMALGSIGFEPCDVDRQEEFVFKVKSRAEHFGHGDKRRLISELAQAGYEEVEID